MLDKTLENEKFSHLLIVGDFNYPSIKWETWSAPSDNIEDKNNVFLETLKDHFLYQNIDKPTRGRGTQKANIVDLILTNEEDMISELEHLSPLGKSDHELLKFKYNCYISRFNSKQARYSYNRGDYDSIRETMRINWTEKLESLNSVEEKWQFIKKVISDAIEIHIPKRQLNSK